jgi:hypothetical protein
MKSEQLVSATITKPLPGPSAKTPHNISQEIASILILTAAEKQ